MPGKARNDVLAVGLIVVNAWMTERLEDAVNRCLQNSATVLHMQKVMIDDFFR